MGLFVLVVASSAPALAQDPIPLPVLPYAARGTLEIEGGLDYRYVHVGHTSTSAVVLTPAVRYFIMNGLSVGLGFGYTWVTNGAQTFVFLPQAEYNVNMGSRLFPYVGVGAGVQYIREGGQNSTNSTDFVLQPGVGVKIAMGGGLIGLGLAVPLVFSGDFGSGINILTRYAIYF